ncbi:MAG: hypothetical protein Q7R56_00410 [Nanoarchaeota archaeon]|nr:hypothetical protein [Nanoarchaeota archaeon]
MSSIFPFAKIKVKEAIEFERNQLHQARATEYHFKKNSNQKSKRVFKVYKTDTMCLMLRTK